MKRGLAKALLASGVAFALTGMAFAATGPNLKEPPKATVAEVEADKITYDGNSKVAEATGTVVIVYGQYVLTATHVTYDTVKDRFTANGSVALKEDTGYTLKAPALEYDAKADVANARSSLELTDPEGNILTAEEAELRNGFKQGFARHLKLLLKSDATVTAEYATRVDGNTTIFERATYTACKNCTTRSGKPLWQVVSSRVRHDQKEHTLYHRNARLEVGGVPIFWTPYLSHPDPSVKRRSGFLVPSIKAGDAYGYGVETPYFINLAPNYDITLKPTFTTKQGVLAEAQWRHRLNSGTYKVDAAGIYQLDTLEPAPGDTHWRGGVLSQGDFNLGKGWTWGWDGGLVSDRTFLGRYDISGADQITNRLYLENVRGRNYFSAEALHYRTLLTTESQGGLPSALPYVQYSYLADRPLLGGEFGFDTSSYYLWREKTGEPFPGIAHGDEQLRTSATAHWKLRHVSSLGAVVTPFASLRGDVFTASDLPVEASGIVTEESDTVARILPTAGVDLRYPLAGTLPLGQSLLTPVAQIVWSGEETGEKSFGNEDAISLNFDQTNLFLADRFSGRDRVESGLRVNAGLTYSLLFPNGGFLRLSGGESFHLAGENSFTDGSGLEGPESDLVGAIAFQPNDHVSFNYQIRAEEDLSDINAMAGGLSLTFDRISGQVSYTQVDSAASYGRPDRDEQIWGNAAWNFAGAWSLLGSFRYDLEDSYFMSKSLGLAFNCDCMGFSLTYSESEDSNGDIQPSRSLYATVRFKTLGSASGGSGF